MSFTCDSTGSWWMMSKNAPSRSTSKSSRANALARSNRHQLDGRHAELLEMFERRLGRERLVRAPQMVWNVGMADREAAHVHLVDDGVVPRRPGRTIVAPGKCGVDDGSERRVLGVVAIVE